MSGELVDGGIIVGSFHGHEKTHSGSSGACKLLSAMSENVYTAIERWLAEPTMNADLR